MKSFAVTVLLITTTTKVSCFVSIISQKALVTSSYCCSSYHRQRQQQHHPSMGNKKKKKKKTDNNDSQVLSCHWWGQAEIDYSAANEYIDVHYGDDAPRRPYFETFGLKEESIYDARFGVTIPTEFDFGTETSSSINHQTVPPTLKNCGFTLVSNLRHFSNQQIKEQEQEQEKKKRISDWTNLDEIQEYYLPELEELLQKLYDDDDEEEDKDDQLPSSSSRIEKEEHNHDDNEYSLKQQQQQQQQQQQREGRNKNRRTIRHLIFWNPMLRARDLEQIRLPEEFKKTPTASFAASPHIDTDVNAYPRLEELLDLLEKNEVTTASSNSTSNIKDKQQRSQRRKEILRDIRERNCGFAIVNAWRNIGSKPANPPLGLFSVRYNNNNNNNNNNNKNNNRHSYQGFPEAAPDMDHSKWYIFSDIGQDEILFFCQYDRDGSWPSDLWHCALTKYLPSSSAAAAGGGGSGGSCSSHPPFSRESFDIRCFIVFDQQVPEKQDRYNRGRGGRKIESKLTMEESGCFCENQFKVRDARNKT